MAVGRIIAMALVALAWTPATSFARQATLAPSPCPGPKCPKVAPKPVTPRPFGPSPEGPPGQFKPADPLLDFGKLFDRPSDTTKFTPKTKPNASDRTFKGSISERDLDRAIGKAGAEKTR